MEAIGSELQVLKFEALENLKVFKDNRFSPKERVLIEAKKKCIISEIMLAKRRGASEVEIVLDLIEKIARLDFMSHLLDEVCDEMITTGKVNMAYK